MNRGPGSQQDMFTNLATTEANMVYYEINQSMNANMTQRHILQKKQNDLAAEQMQVENNRGLWAMIKKKRDEDYTKSDLEFVSTYDRVKNE